MKNLALKQTSFLRSLKVRILSAPCGQAFIQVLRRFRHHPHLGDAIQELPEHGVIHLRAVHHAEGAAGETLRFIHRFAALEDERTTETLEKPRGDCQLSTRIFPSVPKGRSQTLNGFMVVLLSETASKPKLTGPVSSRPNQTCFPRFGSPPPPG